MSISVAANTQEQIRRMILEAIRAAGETPYVVGRCAAGEKGVDIC